MKTLQEILQDSVKYLEAEIKAEASAQGRDLGVRPAVVEGALEALVAGDAAAHDRMVTEAILALGNEHPILVAQYSMERVLEAVTEQAGVPVLGAATEGARRLGQVLRGEAPAPTATT